jgi:hypothetical protein
MATVYTMTSWALPHHEKLLVVGRELSVASFGGLFAGWAFFALMLLAPWSDVTCGSSC